jgi:hypothetical protein
MFRTSSLGFLIGFTLAVASSCGGGTKNLCVDKNISCEAPLSCDSTDALCKCGGRGGVVCGEGFSCNALTNTCESSRCKSVDCSDKPGTSCDVVTGDCKCGGTGGRVCAAGTTCNPASKLCAPTIDCTQTACPANMACNSQTGQCTCGGAACAAGERCVPAQTGADAGQGGLSCVPSKCFGVECSGANTCDSERGYCTCNGNVCQNGQACGCSGGEDAGCAEVDRSCRASSVCQTKTCPQDQTCDPVDGQCKCGGPGGPACASNQICALGPPAQCQGGSQCTSPDGGSKVCAGGTSCDPEDGVCKCGGRGGAACRASAVMDPGEVCVSNPFTKACRRPCDVRAPDCPTGTACYFDGTAATPTAYCAAASDIKLEDEACSSATACFITTPPRPLHCVGLVFGQSGICRPYCDVAAGQAGCVQVPKPQNCVQITGAPAGYGFCQQVN